MSNIKTTELTYNDQNTQSRLDKWLFTNNALPGLSRSIAHNMIKAGTICVNNKTVATGYKLKPGDIIQIYECKPEQKKSSPIREVLRLDIKQYIIHDTPDFVIINKPANVLVHPDTKNKDNTLIDYLIKLYPEIATIDNSNRPGIVHRLDRDVSGLLVVAKTKKMFAFLKSQFKNRLVQKKYLAMVYGTFAKTEGVINFRISRSFKYPKMAAHPVNKDGKEAITEWIVKKQYQQYTLLDIHTLTGRTNQIRLHLNAIDHPIIGDRVYSSSKYKKRNRDINSILLHAYYLQFSNITGEQLEFKNDLPPTFKNFISKLAV